MPSLRRLPRARGGNFAILAALSAAPLVLLAGGAIDLSIAQSHRGKLQSSADAAALAAAKRYAVDPDPSDLAKVAEQYFVANRGDLYRTKSQLLFDGVTTANGSREVRLRVRYSYDPIFVPNVLAGVAGLGREAAELTSAVAVSTTTVEVALVLDTSGSMGYSPAAGGPTKIQTLRSQATLLAERFFASAGTGADKATQLAVVPFSGGVNLGPQYLNADWMDPEGLSPAQTENFNPESYTEQVPRPATPLGHFLHPLHPLHPFLAQTSQATTSMTTQPLAKRAADGSYYIPSDGNAKLTRQYLFKKGASLFGPDFAFKGCVETRWGKAGITDVAPDKRKPETLFVPWFAPDEPDTGSDNSYLEDRAASQADPFGEKQENVNKYLVSPKRTFKGSPNRYCDSNPVLPLQAQLGPVKDAIGKLAANGSTNVEEGVAWGWRILSRGAPFTEGRPAGDPGNVKAIILMTDGENTYFQANNPNRSQYGSHGYSVTEHIFEETSQPKVHTNANFTLAMEARTRKVCENAKADGRRPMLSPAGTPLRDAAGPVMADGVVIFTIAFDIPHDIAPRIRQVLTDCASYKEKDLRDTDLAYAAKAKSYYPVGNEAELKAAFTDIMVSLSKMRISQ